MSGSTKFRTWKSAPGLLDRLMGRTKGFYKTKITNGEKEAYGIGPTPEDSQKAAKENWDRKLGRQRDQDRHP